MLVRNVTLTDSIELFSWRNDPITRRASLNTSEIKWDDHEDWFHTVLQDPKISIFIVEEGSTENRAFGMCRFNISPDSEEAEVSINLNPQQRGKGLARNILHDCIVKFAVHFPEIKTLTATIREENIPSMKIFLAENFLLKQTIEGIAQLELNLKR